MAQASKRAGAHAVAHAQTIAEVKELLARANASTFSTIERSLAADTRKGVIAALEATRKRLQREQAEQNRLDSLYQFQSELVQSHGATLCVGLDEVGRGAVAGPLAVGAVILPDQPRIAGLNDSKQLSPESREVIAARIKEVALAWTVQYIEPDQIDACGMTACLVMAFRKAVRAIEEQGFAVDFILLDGNPLRFDAREHNVIKGDAKCASIAAASVVAKVTRDALMVELAQKYPAYDWDSCKGYASKAHIEAIQQYGLTPLHRASFCQSFLQESLF